MYGRDLLEDTDLINTDAELTAIRTHYVVEYSQQKLNDIHSHLWSAGSKDNISALHHQKVLCREVILSERSDLHLVWFDRIIYIKPLPMSFLNHNFINAVVLPDAILYGNVLGFLYSYMMLIQHASDLCLAHELGLISKKIEWIPWRQFRTSFLDNISSGQIPRPLMNKRFEYGELRLARLNYISALVPWLGVFHHPSRVHNLFTRVYRSGHYAFRVCNSGAYCNAGSGWHE
jgi:hypothetical protein